MRMAIIPARGGSKRIPRKNIKTFAGRPMISYALAAAKNCGIFDAIVVSTDDLEIAEFSRSAGALVPFVRPPELSNDLTPTVPVVDHAIKRCESLGLTADTICCIYPCVPLIDMRDLVQAYDLLARDRAVYVFPVVPFPAAIQRALRRAQDGTTQPFDDRCADTRTQDLDPAFYDAGQFYWGARDTWLTKPNIHAHARTIVLPEWRAVDIDTPDDWSRAELLYKALLG